MSNPMHDPMHTLELQIVNSLVEQLDGTLELYREGVTQLSITFPQKEKPRGYLGQGTE